MATQNHLQFRPGILLAVMLLGLAGLAGGQTMPGMVVWLKGGHARPINGVACSPDGTVIASASDDATLKLWSTNGVLLGTLNTDPFQITALAFSPDGTKLVAGAYRSAAANSGLGQTLLYQTTGGWQAVSNISVLRTSNDHYGKVTAVAFSVDSAQYVSGGAEGSNVVRRVSDGTLLAVVAGYSGSGLPATVNAVAFSSGGLLASGADDNTISVWNSAWNLVWSNQTAHASNVTAVAFSPDGTQLVTGSLDQTLKVWNATNGTLVRTLSGHTDGVNAAAFSPDGTEVVSGSSDQTAIIWNAGSGAVVATLRGHVGPVNTVTFTVGGQKVVTGGRDNTIKLWSASGGTLLQSLGDQTGYIRAVAVSPDGMLMASLCDDQTIVLRQVLDGTLVAQWVGHSDWASALAFSPDGTMLASGGGTNDAPLKLWSTNGTLVRVITNGCNGVSALAFSPDGTMLASGGDFAGQVIQIWNPATGALLQTLTGHSNGVSALAFSPDGTKLASGGREWDNAVKLWRLNDGAQVGNYPDLTANGVTNSALGLAYSPDGTSVAASGDQDSVVRVWKVADGSVRNFGAGTNPVPFVAFSPDGTTLASGLQNAINFWNVTNGTLIQSYTQETFRVSCLAYPTSGNAVVMGRADGTVGQVSILSLGSLQSLTLQVTNVLQTGGTAQAEVWANYATATNNVTADPNIIYSSSNTNMFTVNATGLMSGWSVGAATLMAAYGGQQVTNLITVNAAPSAPGPVTQLIWTTQPGNVVSGHPFGTQPVLKTADASGIPSTNGLPPTLNVTVALTAGMGPLLGTTNYNIGTAGGNGVVTFTNLEIDTPCIANQLVASAVGAFNPVTGAMLWLDASDLSTLTTNATKVQAWKNKGGSGATGTNLWFTQNTTSLQPWLTNQLNGKPVVTFSKQGNTYYAGSTYLGNIGQSSYTNSGSQMTCFVVARQNEDSIGWQGPVSFSAPGQIDGKGTAGVVVLTDGTGTAPYPFGIQRNHPATPMQADIPASTVNTAFLLTFVDNAGSASLYSTDANGNYQTNGANIVNGISPYGYGITDVAVGSRLEPDGSTVDNGWDGDVAEVLVYNTALSTTNRTTVEGYLKSKWLGIGSGSSLSNTPSVTFVVQFSGGTSGPITGVTVNESGFATFTYATTASNTYYIQVTTNLAPASWTVVPGSTNMAMGTATTFTDTNLPNSNQRFYRTVFCQ